MDVHIEDDQIIAIAEDRSDFMRYRSVGALPHEVGQWGILKNIVGGGRSQRLLVSCLRLLA